MISTIRQHGSFITWMTLWAVLGQAILLCCPGTVLASPATPAEQPAQTQTMSEQSSDCHGVQKHQDNDSSQAQAPAGGHCDTLQDRCCMDTAESALLEKPNPRLSHIDISFDIDAALSTTLLSSSSNTNNQLTLSPFHTKSFGNTPRYLAHCAFLE